MTDWNFAFPNCFWFSFSSAASFAVRPLSEAAFFAGVFFAAAVFFFLDEAGFLANLCSLSGEATRAALAVTGCMRKDADRVKRPVRIRTHVCFKRFPVQLPGFGTNSMRDRFLFRIAWFPGFYEMIKRFNCIMQRADLIDQAACGGLCTGDHRTDIGGQFLGV